MAPDAEDLATAFARQAGLSNLSKMPAGIEFSVYKAVDAHGNPVVLRVPLQKVFCNANDADYDACALVRQELAIYAHLAGGPVPVPAPHGFFEEDGYPAMVAGYVEHDGSTVSDKDLGMMMAQIHTSGLPDVPLVGMEVPGDIAATLVLRMGRRFTNFAPFRKGSEAWILSQQDLEQASSHLSSYPTCLLHMDFRDANLRVVNGQISAVVDWTSALAGPAAVDFYRSVELGKLGEEFRRGYAEVRPLPAVTEIEEVLLRLDAALMLSLVFYSEAPDESLQGEWGARVEELCLRLRGLVQTCT